MQPGWLLNEFLQIQRFMQTFNEKTQIKHTLFKEDMQSTIVVRLYQWFVLVRPKVEGRTCAQSRS